MIIPIGCPFHHYQSNKHTKDYMGHRGIFVTEDIAINWPNSFREKWGKWLHIREDNKGPISSRFELKYYTEPFSEILKDIHQTVIENNSEDCRITDIQLIYFHECGGVTKYVIGPEGIKIYEPTDWQKVEEPSHYYCYNCWEPKEEILLTCTTQETNKNE